MKILIIIYSLGYGGAEKQAVVDANALSAKGHEVTVAFPKNGELSKLLAKEIVCYKIASTNIVLGSLQLFFHFISHRYDAIHAHMFWAEKAAAFAGRIFGQRIIMNEHGLGVWRKWYHRLIMRFISKFATKVINSCDATRMNRIEIDGLKPEKLVTVYNSFDVSVPVVPRKVVPERDSNLSGEKIPFRVGFVGRFDPVKRLELYIPLAKLLKDSVEGLKFVMVGAGTDMDKVRGMVKENGLEEYFEFPGFVIDPWNYLKEFDVFFMPSLREAFSIALLEAGYFYVPAVAFDVGGNSELIKDGYTGYVVPNGDIETVSKKILYLYENRETCAEMGRLAHSYVTEMFSVEKRIERLERLYTE